MKYIVSKILFLVLLINYNSFSQTLTEEKKQIVLDNLNDPSLNVRSAALESIIKYEIYEARDVLESKIWNEKRILQPVYLEALLVLESPRIYELTMAFIDTINANPRGNDIISPIAEEQKVRATKILFELGDYSTAGYVFDLIDVYKPKTNIYATELLPEIIHNVPEFSEQANNELIYAAKNGLLHERLTALMYIIASIGDDSLPIILGMLAEDEDPNMRAAILGELLPTKGTPEINLILRNRLSEEEIPSIRIQIADNLLFRFGNPSDYKFVSDFVYQEQDSVTKSIINRALTFFKPREPDSSITALTMLDTLISYTNQCYEYEWINNQRFYDKLIKKIEKAKKELEKEKVDEVKKEIVSFQNEVYMQNGKYITDDGYKFLYYYPDYILGQFPAGEHLIIDSLSPTITVTKTKKFKLTVYGSNFSKKSDVYFNGKKQKTKFISENELEAEIKDKDIKKEGTYAVHVSEKKIGRTEQLEFNVYKELPERLVPVLNCVEDLEGKKSIAWFGYENYNEGTVLIEGKKENEIKGGKKPKGKGQKDEEVPPVIFLPGVHEKVFSVEFDDKKKLKWELLKEKAEVTEETPECE